MAAATKTHLRSELLAARRAVPDALRRAEADQLCAHLSTAIGDR